MASAGPNGAGAGADDSAVGTLTWSSTGNITAEDSSGASFSGAVDDALSHYLVATTFGFSIPAGATIDGIIVEIKRQIGSSTSFGRKIIDSIVKIVKGGAVSGNNKADTVTEWPTLYDYASYGGSSDLWGVTWGASDINASDFGVAISAKMDTSFGATAVGEVDYIRITVHYTEAASGQPAVKRMGGVKFNTGPFGHGQGVRGW